MSYLLIRSDARRVPLRDASIHCVISSPPYFGLRDYLTGRWEGGDDSACDHVASPARRAVNERLRPTSGPTRGGSQPLDEQPTYYRDLCPRCGARRVDRQIGLERDVDSYVAALAAAFREVRRVLRDDGLFWLNLGDSFSGYHGNRKHEIPTSSTNGWTNGYNENLRSSLPSGLGSKQLLMIPHRVALALQADGWIVRDALIWSKADMTEDLDIDGGVMPGSQRDRCTFAYEMLFMLAKQPRYYFDRDALRSNSGALLRNVWRLNTTGSKISHFALMPPEMARRCVLLATSEKGCCPHCGAPWRRVTESVRKPTRPGIDTKCLLKSDGDVRTAEANGWNHPNVIGNRDPQRHCTETTTVGWRPSCHCPEHVPVPCTVADFFCGAGTTVLTATALGRRAVGCDLSHDYLTMARDRIDRPHKKTPRPAPADGDDLPLFRRDDS